MDRVLNPKNEKQIIYEIYRACRLCGAGAGYKMPIIQNIVDLDGDGIELRHKIKECVQIEVNHTDRMPPLICELCVDKVNDFYQFLNMCKQTNRRTRTRLGLPLQTRTRESENCILGVTEALTNDNTDVEPLGSLRGKQIRIKKEFMEPQVIVQTETPQRSVSKARAPSRESSHERTREPRATRQDPSPAPKRHTRQNVDPPILTPQLRLLPTHFKPLPPPMVLKVIQKTEGASVGREQKSKLKRSREKEIRANTPPSKRLKFANEPVKLPKSEPKSSKHLRKQPPKQAKPNMKTPPHKPPSETLKAPAAKPAPTKSPVHPLKPPRMPTPEAPAGYSCDICGQLCKTSHGLAMHRHKHTPHFTSPKLACNACELWFPSPEEASAHHRHHRVGAEPYKCTRCYGYFKQNQDYENHFAEQLCLSVYEVPDVKCWECWGTFPTTKLMEDHPCGGEDARPGGECSKCSRSFALLKNLLKHEESCSRKKKDAVTVDPAVQARLLPMQVRLTRCDPLLAPRGHVDVSRLTQHYGLDKTYRYPYLRTEVRVKRELCTKPFSHMVSINDDVKAEFKDYAHWDTHSDGSVDQSGNSLGALSLQTITDNCLSKASKKKKREGKCEFDIELSKKIDNILDNLGDENSLDSDSILYKKDQKEINDSLTSFESSVLGDESKKSNEREKMADDKVGDNDEKIGDAVVKIGVTIEKMDSASERMDEAAEATATSEKVERLDTITEINIETDKKCTATEEVTSIRNDKNDESIQDVDCPKNSTERVVDSNDDTKTIVQNDDVLNVKESDDVKSSSNESNNLSVSRITKSNVENSDCKETSDLECIDENNQNIDNAVSVNETQNIVDVNRIASNNNTEQNNVEIDHKNIDIDHKNIKIDHENIEIEHKNIKHEHLDSGNLENFSKIDEITNKILKHNVTSQEHTKVDQNLPHNDVEDGIHKSDARSDSVSLNSVRSDANGVETQDKYNADDLSDEHRKLLAELDEQIGENDHQLDGRHGLGETIPQKENNDNNLRDGNIRKGKGHLIDDLLKKQDPSQDLPSTELDNISDDEFDFDA